jgi:hypothetical protein
MFLAQRIAIPVVAKADDVVAFDHDVNLVLSAY